MVDYLLIRPEDHVVLGLSWSGLVVTDAGAGRLPVLEALDGAWVVLAFPPQHVGEGVAIADLSGGPVWARLSGASRVAFDVAPRTRLVPTVEGVLQALRRRQLRPRPTGVPGPGDTAIELPWRLVLSPESPADSHDVVAVHPAQPVTASDVAGLWRTRIVATPRAGGTPTPVEHPYVDLVAVDRGLADAPDPVGHAIPLSQGQRRLVVTHAGRRPARGSCLELSALGGTLAATGEWDNYLWEHRAVLGRDMWVRTLAKGALYPLGHRAEYEEFTERRFDRNAEGAAVLRQWKVLTVTEPVRQPPGDARARRAFPFDEVEITTRSFADLGSPVWQTYPIPGAEATSMYFWPATADGRKLMFPVRCGTPDGDLRFRLPLIFVSDLSPVFSSLTDPGLTAELKDVYKGFEVPLPGRHLNLVRSAGRDDGDVQEVHGITVAGGVHAGRYRPRLAGMRVGLPALRALLGDARSRPVRFTESYLRNGEAEEVVLELTGPPIDITFVGRADRSGGLVAPRYEANGISRKLGLVNRHALPGAAGGIDPRRLLHDDATLLGFRLVDLIKDPLDRVPQVTSLLRPGRPPAVKMSWHDVALTSDGPFKATSETRLSLDVTHSEEGSETTCTVRGVALELPLLTLHFGELMCTQAGGKPPRVTVTDVRAEFLGALQLLRALQDHVGLGGAQPFVEVTKRGVEARYSLELPTVPAGAFVMRNIVFSMGISVPFDGEPVTVALAFAGRQNPFGLSVLMFGGGGYVEAVIDPAGLSVFEAALEFGAFVEVDFLVASAEVHALGGARFELDRPSQSVALTGYLRIGGCVQVLGLVSVSVELRIELAYRPPDVLAGRATLVIEIDLWLWSATVELDTGEWVFAGGGATRRSPAFAALTGSSTGGAPYAAPAVTAADDDGGDEGLARWQEYRRAFVSQGTGGSP